MKKSSPSDNTPPGGNKVPAGRRSGKGASSVMPYLAEATNTRPAPLEPAEDDDKTPPRRWRWKW